MIQSGVYRILCTASGKFYLGSSKHIGWRWASHIKMLKDGNHHCDHLQSSWTKYGESRFEFAVLDYCLNWVEREQEYIDLVVDKSALLNSSLVAAYPEISPGGRAKMSVIKKAYWSVPENRAAQSARLKVKWGDSPDRRERMKSGNPIDRPEVKARHKAGLRRHWTPERVAAMKPFIRDSLGRVICR